MNTWQEKKKANWYEGRAKFKPEEVKEMNIEAYDLGATHVMEAVAELFGLGPKRLEEAKETLDRTSYRELHEYAESFSTLDWRRHLTKHEAGLMNQESYCLGVEHTRESVGYAYRLGDTRLARLDEQLKQLQASDLGRFMKTGNLYEARLQREARRAKNPSKKGAILNG